MLYRLFILIILALTVSGCGLLDRQQGDVADLEPIPEEPLSQEPSILIDDQEMMNAAEEFVDDVNVDRDEQISADPSGTFVGQKIGALREDYNAVMDAFITHRDAYEEAEQA